MACGLSFLTRASLRLAPIIAFFAAWHVVVSLGLVNRTIIPLPSEVAWKTATLFGQPQLRQSLALTVQEIGIALIISIVVGIPLGAATAASRRFAAMLQPIVSVLLAAPMISFIPIIIMIAGISPTSVVVVAVLASIALVAVNTRTGVETIDPLLGTVARTFGHGRIARFWKLTIPGALPYIIVGVRLGAGRAILGVVVGEYFAGTDGLAYRAVEFQNFLQVDSMYAAVAWLIALGVGINTAASTIEEKFSEWRRT